MLRTGIELDAEIVMPGIERVLGLDETSPWGAPLRKAIEQAFRRKLSISIETDVRVELKQRADKEAARPKQGRSSRRESAGEAFLKWATTDDAAKEVVERVGFIAP